MDRIENKLKELWDLVKVIPNECKGDWGDAPIRRHTYMKISSSIRDLMDDIARMNELCDKEY